VVRLVTVSGLVRDPAERTAIGHAHAERLAALGYARREQRRLRDDVGHRGGERFLGGAIEIAGPQPQALQMIVPARRLRRRRIG
jgi:hypothetical protein